MRFADLGEPPVPAYQSIVEFGALWDIAHRLIEPQHIVEIGSLFGGTLWYWLQMPGVESVTSVDLLTDFEPLHAEVAAARALWPSWSDRLHIVEGDSQASTTIDLVRSVTETIDVLFLDGDHSGDGVRADFERWSPLVRPGGLVAFHDTVLNGTRDEPGVRALVAELKRRWRLLSIELFDPDGAGITAFVL